MEAAGDLFMPIMTTLAVQSYWCNGILSFVRLLSLTMLIFLVQEPPDDFPTDQGKP